MAITRVQSTCGSTAGTNGTSLTLTFSAAPSNADGKNHYIVVAVGTSSGTLTMSITADYSWFTQNTYGANTTDVYLFWARVFGTGSATLTINSLSGTAVAICAIAAEYKSDNPLRLDRAANAVGNNTAASTGTTSTTSSAAELCLAGLASRCQAAGSTQTTGSLIVGHSYKIATYVAGDNFTNVGASSNATGVSFIATGTTPTTYTNGSTLTDLTGAFTAITNSYTEIAPGGITTNVNTANSDRQVDLLEKFLSSTGTTTTGATVATNQWTGTVLTFEEFVGIPLQINRISGS